MRLMDQKSATISEIQRSHRSQALRRRVRSRIGRSCARSDSTSRSSAARLVPDLVHQRGGDAVADHPLAGDADQGDRVVAAARQPGPGPADGAAQPPVQRADHRRPLEEPARHQQRLGGRDVQPGQQDPVVVLAALGDDLGEQVELGQRVLEAQPQHPEPALLLGRRGAGARALAASAGTPRARSCTSRRPAIRYCSIPDSAAGDSAAAARWVSWSTNGWTEREPGQQRAGLLLQEPGRGRVGAHRLRPPGR